MKPAGTETDEKAVAACVALLISRDLRYSGISSLWTGCCLQRGLLYARKSDSACFVSLGFVEYVAIGWRMDRIDHGDKTYYRPSTSETYLDAIGNVEFLTNLLE